MVRYCLDALHSFAEAGVLVEVSVIQRELYMYGAFDCKAADRKVLPSERASEFVYII